MRISTTLKSINQGNRFEYSLDITQYTCCQTFQNYNKFIINISTTPIVYDLPFNNWCTVSIGPHNSAILDLWWSLPGSNSLLSFSWSWSCLSAFLFSAVLSKVYPRVPIFSARQLGISENLVHVIGAVQRDLHRSDRTDYSCASSTTVRQFWSFSNFRQSFLHLLGNFSCSVPTSPYTIVFLLIS